MAKRRRGKNRWQVIIMLAICVIAGMFSMSASNPAANVLFTVEQIAPYVGNSYTVVNGNVPYFEEQMFEMDPFEEYEPLDELGRATGTDRKNDFFNNGRSNSQSSFSIRNSLIFR